MCGIAGIWNRDGAPVSSHALVAAGEAMASRGPDQRGIYLKGNLGLIHQRLSIIDLSEAGRMPMESSRGKTHGLFNGEIYNFDALRAELIRDGYTFRGRSDGEVLVASFDRHGPACFKHLEGMFAAAFWSEQQRTLTLARDPMGQKPLYYLLGSRGEIAFASTIWALKALAKTTPSLQEAFALRDEGIAQYLGFGYVPGTETILEGVRKLAPGTWLRFEMGKAEPEEHRYFSLAEAAEGPRLNLSVEEAEEELHTRLRSAVRKRLVADVPLGAFLSGGIDSSLVVSMMAEAGAVRAFNIGFQEDAFDESRAAQAIARHLGVEITTRILRPQDVQAQIPTLMRALDEPMADYSMLPTLSVCELAARDVTVALTGDGADEEFAGYRYYIANREFELYAKALPAKMRKALWRSLGDAAPLRRLGPARLRRALSRSTAEDPAAYFARSGFMRGAAHAHASRAFQKGTLAPSSALQTVESFIRERSHLRPIEAGLLFDATHTLPEAWLTKVDRASMAYSLEARSPFLDASVATFAFSLPLSLRLRGLSKKFLLRRILSRYLPKELYERPKRGFTAPVAAWFRGPLRQELHDRLHSSRIRDIAGMKHDGIATLLQEHDRKSHDHAQLLWAIFLLDTWLEQLSVPSS